MSHLRPTHARRALAAGAAACLLLLPAALVSCGESTGPTPNPTPNLSAVTPDTVTVGGGGTTLTITGGDFVRSSVVRWNGIDRPTTYVSATELAATVAAADFATPGAVPVTVFNGPPGGGTSNPMSFTVKTNPVPVLLALSQNTVTVESPGIVLGVAGSGFMPGSVVRWNGAARATVFVSATELTATIPQSDFAAAGTNQVTVFTGAPGGGSSAALPFVVKAVPNPTPALAALSPSAVSVGAGAVTVTATGSGFYAATTARLFSTANPTGLALAVSIVSPTELTLTIPATQTADARAHTVIVSNPPPDGGSSNSMPFEVRSPAPALTSLGTTTAFAGDPGFTLEVTGSGFYAGSVVRWNGAPRTTTYLTPTRLAAQVLAGDISAAGAYEVTVANPAPGGGTTAAMTFTVQVGAPVLTRLPSLGAVAGRPGFSLAVDGNRFTPTSVVRWKGAARPTTYVSATRLLAAVSDADVASAGTAQVDVTAAGAGTSDALTFTVRTMDAPAITNQRTLAIPANDIVWDPGTARLYASVPSTHPTYGNRVVAIDPTDGTVTGSVFVGSEPATLALSGDGQYLYVALEGSGDVRRVHVPTLVAGLQFSLGGGQVEEMLVVPGAPGTVVLSKKNPGTSPRHLGVFAYDNGSQRATATPGHTGSNSITFATDAATVYGYNNETTEFGFRTMALASSGLTITNTTGGLVDQFYTRIAGEAGRVYATSGQVIDPELRTRTGTFTTGYFGASVAVRPDAALGRVFFISAGTVKAFDMNTLQHLGSVTVSGMSDEHPALTRLRLVRWGADGLAWRDGRSIFILRTTLAAP